MPIEPAAAEEEVVPSKLAKSRKKIPKGEIALGQARVVANIIDGFNHLRAAHRAQVQADRRLPIEDMASASAAAAPPESSSAAVAPKKSTAQRGRSRTRAQGSNKTKQPTGGERERSRDRDTTPEFPRENTVLLSDFKRATKTPQKIMRDHFKKNYKHLRPHPKPPTLPISRR